MLASIYVRFFTHPVSTWARFLSSVKLLLKQHSFNLSSFYMHVDKNSFINPA